jgi:glycosyltransferase A (GT-A) superfamily protein (DUF2064 family)
MSAGTESVVLVLAKSPVAGRAKTRLCPPATPDGAARIAAAALMDTLDTVCAVPGSVPMVAWTGELADAQDREELTATLAGIVRFAQRGDSLGERIAAAHTDVAARAPGAAVLQIGMDTPQLSAEALSSALNVLHDRRGPDAVLGPATDGGWWALGLRDPRTAEAIAGVPTSRSDTGERTLHALRGAGLNVWALPEMLDVDTASDALRVAASSSSGRRFRSAVAAVLARTTPGVDGASTPDARHVTHSR